jgi:hypothetical protein
MRDNSHAPPDSPEAVALELLRLVAHAEGTPVEQLKEGSDGRNQPVRAYLLDLYVECLLAARGERKMRAGNTGTH